MTIDELIEIQADYYAAEATPNDIYGNFGKYSIAQAFEDGVKWLLSRICIKTEDAVPEYSMPVLYSNNLKDFYFGYYNKEDNSWCGLSQPPACWMKIFIE